MEQKYQIKIANKKVLEGVLRGDIKKPLILIVHGLCGNMHEALHYNAARFFENKGFSSFRFNLYSFEKNERKLHDCTLQTHGEDIDKVIEFLQKEGAQKIFAVGHSYGFPSLLHSKKNHTLEAIISWDGSVLPRNSFSKLPKISKPVKARLLDEGYLTLMGESMAQEESKVNSLQLAKNFGKLIHMITIDKDGNLKGAKSLSAKYKHSTMHIIKGASHNFTEDGKQVELYEETVRWIKSLKK